MKRYLVLISVLFFLSPISAQQRKTGKASRVLSLCTLVDNWPKYNHQKVRLRAIYEAGGEQSWLYDPACKGGEALTDVSFQDRAKGAMKSLDQIVAEHRRAWVVLEGVFRGPEPFDKIDPKLPASIREGLEKSHKRYGHMNSFDTTIKVTRVVTSYKVGGDVAASK